MASPTDPRVADAAAYAAWRERFRELAVERDLAWLVGRADDAHRAAFDAGLSPEDELQSLADIGQWRGCGCGGG